MKYTAPDIYTPEMLNRTEAHDLDAFESLVLSQQPATQPWTPVTDYSFEARKAIEGIHPQLIKDVFAPERVLDVGCGEGHLVRLLIEAGCPVVRGCDKTPQIGYPWFYTFDVTNYNPASAPWSDLVICREVLEHLTVLEIRKAVTNLCALSSKFVYLTTRLSSEHDLLHVETHDDLDPTHISLLSKDLIKVLFILEGFRWRGDLAEKMDWKKYGRTFVFERAT